jgi:catechol 2,3-dioxygenase-like lactoylglutathione lyase family enzyme
MLGTRNAVATVAVKSFEAARNFYEGKLDLTPIPDAGPGMIIYRTGGTTLFVYESQYAGTNKATAVTWDAGDSVDEIVKALKAKGVAFEHYDFPDTVREGDVHVAGGIRLAWFKDPDGNIHSVASG